MMVKFITRWQIPLVIVVLFATEIVIFTLMAFVVKTDYNDMHPVKPVYLYPLVIDMDIVGLALALFSWRLMQIPNIGPTSKITLKSILRKLVIAGPQIPIGYKVFFYGSTFWLTAATFGKVAELPLAAFSYLPIILGDILAIVAAIALVLWFNQKFQGTVLNPVLWHEQNGTEMEAR
ncbi:MAG: hypothetical protein IT367_17150 [Candidatus Hydrogenedentes bacterium]|nr:hypothetical protein [Candidatus Hydrogenedentota bacterium]